MSKSSYNGIQDERIKNIDKSLEKLAHHVEVLNHEMGDTQKDISFIRANLDAIVNVNNNHDKRMCIIEKRQWFIATGIIITVLVLIANLVS
jgi:predicted RNase H-like nuclease (RuvC/YqgF family)